MYFDKSDVLKAINVIDSIDDKGGSGVKWLYSSYPANVGGVSRRATTGFVFYDGKSYPVKALGRYCMYINSGNYEDLSTSSFKDCFRKLDFIVSSVNLVDDAEVNESRQRRLAEIWMRPGQAKFRIDTFSVHGACCLITGCVSVSCIEAAHVLPVCKGGG